MAWFGRCHCEMLTVSIRLAVLLFYLKVQLEKGWWEFWKREGENERENNRERERQKRRFGLGVMVGNMGLDTEQGAMVKKRFERILKSRW